MELILRTAGRQDAEPLAQLHAASWQRTYRGMMSDAFLDGDALENRRRVWRERLSKPAANQHVCVVDEGGAIVGVICVFAGADAVWGSYIDNLHVAYSHHGRGLGHALMRQAGAWLRIVEPDRAVWLWVMEANTRARGFYECLGAKNTGTSDLEDPGGGRAPNCRYVWGCPAVLASILPAARTAGSSLVDSLRVR